MVNPQINVNTLSPLLYANIQGLKSSRTNKVPFIQGLLEEGNAFLAALTETHIKDHDNSEVWIPGYNLHRSDRKHRTCGGVALYIKDSLVSTEILSHSNEVVEVLGVKIESLNLVVILMYRPPDTTVEEFKPQLERIKTVLEGLEAPLPTIMWLGDFNMPNIRWRQIEHLIIPDGIESNSREGESARALLNICSLFHLDQHIAEPTRDQNVLDLIFTNNENMVHNISITDTTFSDHKLIEVMTNLEYPGKVEKKITRTGPFSKYNFNNRNIDWEAINQHIEEIEWENQMTNKTTEECLNLITEIVEGICAEKIPVRKEKRKSKEERERRKLYRQRKRLAKRLSQPRIADRLLVTLKNKIADIENKLRASHRKQEEDDENKAVQQIEGNPKYFFSYAKRKSRTSSSIGPLIRDDGTYATDDKEMSELLRKQYETVFSQPDPTKMVRDPNVFFLEEDENINQIMDLEIESEDIERAITSMPLHSAPGPDSWNSVLLKNCKTSLSKPLAIMWRKSLDSGEIPESLKNTTIAPLHKGGNKALPKNYRPVALTSHVTKIFERVVRSKITKHMEDNGLYNAGQHGFRAGRSCLSQLLDHYDRILVELEEGKNVDVIYTDFAKAFDKCDHGIIAHKLKEKGISGKIGRWIYNFLSNRKQVVAVNGELSARSVVKSSVPQGTVLAPLLFLILISDIDSQVEHCWVSSFADDTKVSLGIETIDDIERLQTDLNTVFQWARENNMQFNEDKFQLMRYGENQEIKENTTYTTESAMQISRKIDVTDLGVIMSENMSFKVHNQAKAAAAKKLSGWILRTFKTREAGPMLTLFKSLVIPRLEYCSALTSPAMAGDINDLESVQRSFTFHITSVKHLDYWDRLKALNLYSLERRRERYLIIYTWKVIEGIVPNLHTTILWDWSDRGGRKCKIPPLKTKCKRKLVSIRDSWLTNKGPRLFNVLPAEVRNLMDVPVDTFKSKLDQYLKRVPDEPLFAKWRTRGSNSLIDQAPAATIPEGGPLRR